MKYVIFSDIHFGLKNSSQEHNKDCLDFLDFVADEVNKRISDDEDMQVVFCGDWYHVRPTVNVSTLNYGTEGLHKLNNIGNGINPTMLILGNHDLYYSNSRLVSSVVIPEGAVGLNVVDEPLYISETKTLFVPWMINDENLTDLIQKYNPDYVFGHFEIPTFRLNKAVRMPGELRVQDYYGPKRIISGHFHLRDESHNITYIGNCFSHDFGDVNEWNNKGFAILDTSTNQIEYIEWKDAPKYASGDISKLNTIHLSNNMKLKLYNDMCLPPLKLDQLKEELMATGFFREITFLPKEIDVADLTDTTEINNLKNESLGTIISSLLSNCDMESISNKKLLDIYNNL